MTNPFLGWLIVCESGFREAAGGAVSLPATLAVFFSPLYAEGCRCIFVACYERD